MHITEEEFKKYFELKKDYENNNYKLTNDDLNLVNKVNNHAKSCPDCMEKYKNNGQDFMDNITEQYGIDFKNIKHIRLQNGKEYYKLYDKKLNKDYLLEQNDKNKNLSEEFKEIQKSVVETQKYSSETNADEIFRYQLIHSNNGKILYSIEELKNNPNLLYNTNKDQIKSVTELIKNKNKLKLISINLETGIAIDEDHEIVTAELNPITNECEIRRPEEYNYETKEISSNDAIETMNLLDIDSYDITVVDDVPTTINGEDLDPNKVKFYYEYPEALDRETIDKKTKINYLIAIKKLNLIKEAKQKELEKDAKKYVKVKKDVFNKMGFTDVVLLSLLTGFAGGIITTIMYIVIK